MKGKTMHNLLVANGEIDITMVYAVYLLAISILTFFLYGIDKWKARRNAWRVPEKMLILFSLIGGAVGGFLGMKVFRHKTTKEHWYFTLVNILGTVVHLGLLIALLFFI